MTEKAEIRTPDRGGKRPELPSEIILRPGAPAQMSDRPPPDRIGVQWNNLRRAEADLLPQVLQRIAVEQKLPLRRIPEGQTPQYQQPPGFLQECQHGPEPLRPSSIACISLRQ